MHSRLLAPSSSRLLAHIVQGHRTLSAPTSTTTTTAAANTQPPHQQQQRRRLVVSHQQPPKQQSAQYIMKYILVTGGVISGVGKGVIASSFGTLLNCCGINVTSIKIDPYINIDAGTFSPFEHGEVFVLEDGSEVDLDLGNYERFLDIKLHGKNNITTGKIYEQVIRKERAGDFLGKTVQVVPHITNAIQDWVEEVAHQPVTDDKVPEVCIVELGGTIGDIEGMPFVEAFRQFQFRVGRENFCCAHVSLVPQPRSTGEPKTKPTQSSVRELRGLGLMPDLIVCRSENPIDGDVKNKISNFCHVPPEQVICIHDLSSIYHVPLAMEEHNIVDFLKQRLQLEIPSPRPNRIMHQWRRLARKVDTVTCEVRIALVGKYTKLEDSYASVLKSLQHAAIDAGYKLHVKFIEACHLERQTKVEDQALYHEAWQAICKSDGVIVPGGFGSRGMEGKIRACQWCRENQKPFLGICLGFQAAAIEFARNVLNLKNANTKENDPDTPDPVVVEMLEYTPENMGGTMRLGSKKTLFKAGNTAKIFKLYGSQDAIYERHRHRYEINGAYVDRLEKAGMQFVGVDDKNERMEVMELDGHPYYVAVQFHPEYTSRPLRPSPPFVGLILAAKNKLQQHLQHQASRTSPRDTMSDSSSSMEDLELMNGGRAASDEDEEVEVPEPRRLANGTTTSKVNGVTTTTTNGHGSGAAAASLVQGLAAAKLH